MPSFKGLRVLSFESRRAPEIAQLVRNYGGVPVVAPSMREVETASEDEREIVRRILLNEFDVIIFMTGVGARALFRFAEAISPRDQFLSAVGQSKVIVRGSKPAGVMREMGVPITLHVPEPDTWREIVRVLDENPDRVPLKRQQVLIQEHGEASPELYAALLERGAGVTPVRVYRWELPQDIEPLKAAIRELAEKQIDVVMFTSSVQFDHALEVARAMEIEDGFRAGLNHAKVASIGPTSSAKLRENGIRVDLEPSHPKMGFLV
ncbi:MAG: uroporphyrinogen-III synthase, partial [Acidobacteria bacterium]|nr:uroporphyrinogen-III synthase [Acidobacteriota bacterium]